jgi:putative spermidine/putrescine transport system substrate-binding protein
VLEAIRPRRVMSRTPQSRGGLFATAVGAAAVMLIAACGGGGSTSAQVHLTMFIFPGGGQDVVPKAVVKAYEATHPNVSITFIESSTTLVYPKMIAAKQTTPNQNYIDFGIFNASAVAQGGVDKLWDTIDVNNVPNSAHVLPAYVATDHTSIGFQTSFIGLAYSKKYPGPAPDSWTAMWDPKFKGKVSYLDNSFEPLVIAARLNGGDETNIDPGFKIWAAHASNWKAFINSNDALENLLISGDAWLGPWYASIVHGWLTAGAPIGFVVPKEGAVAFPIKMAEVTNMSPAQKKVAEDIMNLLLSPDNAGQYGNLTYSIPLVDNATLTAAQQSDPNLQISIAKNAMQLNWTVMAQQKAAWTARWAQEVKSKIG